MLIIAHKFSVLLYCNDEPLFNNVGLLLFAEPPEENPVKLGDPKVVNIQGYGVDNTGTNLETVKINRAIKDVSAQPGGGVLFFPAGMCLAGTILMQSNVQLYVDAGAVIRGSRKSADYTSAPSAVGGGDLPLTNFVFENCVFHPPPFKPGRITGQNAGPILFKHVSMNGAMVRNAEDLARACLDVPAPVKFEP